MASVREQLMHTNQKKRLRRFCQKKKALRNLCIHFSFNLSYWILNNRRIHVYLYMHKYKYSIPYRRICMQHIYQFKIFNIIWWQEVHEWRSALGSPYVWHVKINRISRIFINKEPEALNTTHYTLHTLFHLPYSNGNYTNTRRLVPNLPTQIGINFNRNTWNSR